MDSVTTPLLALLDEEIMRMTKLSIAVPFVEMPRLFVKDYSLQRDFVIFIRDNIGSHPFSKEKKDELTQIRSSIIQVMTQILDDCSSLSDNFYLEACTDLKETFDVIDRLTGPLLQ